MDILRDFDADEKKVKLLKERRKQKFLEKKRLEQEKLKAAELVKKQEEQKIAVLKKYGILKEPKVRANTASTSFSSQSSLPKKRQQPKQIAKTSATSSNRQKQQLQSSKIQHVYVPMGQEKQRRQQTPKSEGLPAQDASKRPAQQLKRDDSKDVIHGRPVKKLKVGYEGKSTSQYMKDMESARDFNDQLAELFANKESNPEQYAVGLNRVKADISKAKVDVSNNGHQQHLQQHSTGDQQQRRAPNQFQVSVKSQQRPRPNPVGAIKEHQQQYAQQKRQRIEPEKTSIREQQYSTNGGRSPQRQSPRHTNYTPTKDSVYHHREQHHSDQGGQSPSRSSPRQAEKKERLQQQQQQVYREQKSQQQQQQSQHRRHHRVEEQFTQPKNQQIDMAKVMAKQLDLKLKQLDLQAQRDRELAEKREIEEAKRQRELRRQESLREKERQKYEYEQRSSRAAMKPKLSAEDKLARMQQLLEQKRQNQMTGQQKQHLYQKPQESKRRQQYDDYDEEERQSESRQRVAPSNINQKSSRDRSQQSSIQRSSSNKTYDPTDKWSDRDQQQHQHQQHNFVSDRRTRTKQRKRASVEVGLGGKRYTYRDSSEEEDYSDDMEAGYSDIEEEEFVSGKIAEQEDQAEARIRREERKRKKWRLLIEDPRNFDLQLKEVSSEDSDEDDY